MAKKSHPTATEQARLARRAEALRANLQKRKAQLRARKSGPAAKEETASESPTFTVRESGSEE